MRLYNSEEGISMLTATILLVGVTILIAVIVVVFFLSGPLPEEIPRAAIFARDEADTFTLTHMGGDPLKEGAYRIYRDTINGLVDATDDFTSPGGGVWSAGESLAYNGMEELGRVVVTTKSGSTEVILAELGSPVGMGKVTPTPTETVTPTPTEPPDVNFTADPTEGNAPLTVQFTDESAGNVTAWAWDFGDGNTSTVQHPIHTYVTAGNYTVSLTARNAYGFSVETRTDYITALEPPAAAFTANVTEGNAPLEVQFTDESAGNVTTWLWDFGDGNTSTGQNPSHTYESPGNYTVNLTASNAYGNDTCTRLDYIRVTEESFVDIIIEENVFVYGTAFVFGGGNVNGPGATAVITGDLNTADVGQYAPIAVSNIYIDGNVNLDGGSASLGSPDEPGEIHINGSLTLWKGERNIYGDVYVNGDFYLKDARIHGNVYVNGDLTLNWTPWIAENANIYYTGALKPPEHYDDDYATNVVAKCIRQETVPGVIVLGLEIPPTKPEEWYTARGYVESGTLANNIKVFAPSYTSTSGAATNIIIIASEGDISITSGWSGPVTGVFFAPNGKVTFTGGTFEGVVIAHDGFFATLSGSTITFKNIEEYITDPEDYPF